ncbi:MAG TPA: N-acetyl-gamma-glutamyl-phosphate reductase [Bacillales bacterium]|nr:N-acetyl-gamma-glutamyl-phosphate reductase [Bacillales bacterium]
MDVGIVGATGYGGADLIRIVQNHPMVHNLQLYSSSHAGESIQDSFPHFQRLSRTELKEIDPISMGESLDVVFMATPAGISSELTPKLLAEGLRVIDLSGDFRIKDSEIYEAWYKKKPASTKWIEQSVYGLTEWAKEDVKEARLLANPGCYPTATLLGLLPLVQQSLVEEGSIIIDAKTGVSGAGRGLSAASHFSETNENLKIYKVNQHQHTPEIEQELARWNRRVEPVTFSPHLVPMTRGIMATIYAKVSESTTEEKLRRIFQDSYQRAPFVSVRKPGNFPATKEVYGANQCDIGISFDERTGRITIVSVIDNLMKGAAGQAIQNLNVMFGLEETAGLDFLPVYP